MACIVSTEGACIKAGKLLISTAGNFGTQGNCATGLSTS